MPFARLYVRSVGFWNSPNPLWRARETLLACGAMLEANVTPPAQDSASTLVQREEGLHQNLSPRQVAMIGLGATIGTGLFLGSSISVKLAGPAVLLSFLIGALITLPVMWALAEMAAEHPAAGSFGLYGEMYLHPWAGFAMRYAYWICVVVVIGSEVAAAAIYCKLWFPQVPALVWIGAFSALLVGINVVSVKSFGTFEYWLAMIKVVTIVVFLILGTMLIFGIFFPRVGVGNYTGRGGFLPNGWTGVGLGVVMAIFSFLGLEVVGATAGEAENPKVAVPRALRRTLFFLSVFYLGGLAIVVGIVPWKEVGLGESPFVRVFQMTGIPAATHIMNFVVLTAALSSAMCNLYFAARLLFSLARGGYAPAVFGRLSKKRMPVAAVLTSSVGMAAAMVLANSFQETKAFLFMIGAAFFGGPFIWLMILITHLAFRRKISREGKHIVRIAPAGSWSSVLGIIALLAVLISTWWIPGFQATLRIGPAWLIFLTLCYFIWRKSASGTADKETTPDG